MPRGLPLLLIAVVLILASAIYAWNRRVVSHEQSARKIEALLQTDRGLIPTPTFPTDDLAIRLKLERRKADDAANACTVVKINREEVEYVLPGAWSERRNESEERIAAFHAVLARLRAGVREKIAATGLPARSLRGEVVAPSPSGSRVPQADLVEIVIELLSLGMREVTLFRGGDLARPEALTAAGAPPLLLTLTRAGAVRLAERQFDLAVESEAEGSGHQIQALERALRAVIARQGSTTNERGARATTDIRIHSEWGTNRRHLDAIMGVVNRAGSPSYKLQFTIKRPAEPTTRR